MKTSIPFLALTALSSAQQNQDTIGIVEALRGQQDLSVLYAALLSVPDLAATLVNAVNITIFAPTNSAFENLLASPPNAANVAISEQDVSGITNILSYHVLPGTYLSSAFTEVPVYVPTLFTSESTAAGAISTNVTDGQRLGVVEKDGSVQVLSGDFTVSNVVEADIFLPLNQVTVHKIDRVLSIPRNLTSTLPEVPEPYSLTALVGAAAQAGLAETLDTAQNITIFVPTNAAFNAIGSVVEAVDVETLTAVLNYHVLSGVFYTSDLPNGQVQAGDLTINGVDGTIFINGAKVVLPNIALSNGVAHVIDAVLNPDAPIVDATSLRPEKPAQPQFSGASSADVAGALATVAPSPTITRSVPGGLVTSTISAASAPASGSANSPATYSGAAVALQTGTLAGLAGAVVAAIML